MTQKIHTDHAPAAIGPYSQAVKAGDFVYVSGQLPIDPASGEMPADVEGQALQSLKNIEAILKEAGCGFDQVVKTTVYLANMGDFAAVNQVYAGCFTGEVLPARAAFQVAALPKNALVEIEAVAYLG